MRDDARAYYRELGREYPDRIRQLVPAYDEMADTLVGLLARILDGGTAEGDDPARESAPRVLDLGIGEGTLASRVLAALPGVRLTGVDASTPMLERAERRLSAHRDRLDLLEADLAELEPPTGLSGAYSSLTLHNLSAEGKATLLERLRASLSPGAPFLWADLIRHPDPDVQDHFTRRRIEVARDRGCPEDFIAWNFEKEGEVDDPVAPDDVSRLGREAGFEGGGPVWMRGVFALFLLRA